jgi:hypothetical protein
LRDPGCGDPAATGQSGCGRTLLEYAFEHGFRSARHCEFVGEDHDRRCDGVYVDRLDAGTAGVHRFALGVAIDTGDASGESESNAGSGATSAGARTSASNVTGRIVVAGCVARSFTCG